MSPVIIEFGTGRRERRPFVLVAISVTLFQKHLERLRGQNAWITGGKRIGRVVARALAEQGVNLVVSYLHSRAEAEEVVSDATALGVRATAVQADVASKPSFQAALEKVRPSYPAFHILVNMASVFEPVSFDGVTEHDWSINIGAHVLGTFWPTQILAPLMPRGSHIINIADRTSIGPTYTGNLAYVVSKGAVETMTRVCAKELGPRGLFVNAIAPGPILPPPFTPREEWSSLRAASPVKVPVTDQEAIEQFALLVVYLSVVTFTSGWTFSLDQGQNL